MAYKGFRVTYSIRWQGAKSAYTYQRFFRAIYGYKQVVSKSNGRRYTYFRRGVLTNYPFIKEGRTTVIVPSVALQPLITFLKTGQNPAHRFNFTGQWPELVKYSMEETVVPGDLAADAVISAVRRVTVPLVSGSVSAHTLLEHIDSLSPDDVYSLYYSIKPIISSEWFAAVRSVDPEIYSRVQALLSML